MLTRPKELNAANAKSFANPFDEPTLARGKSSKRHDDYRVRELQLQSLTSPIPIPKRPGGESPQLFRRGSKKRKGEADRNLQDPSSVVSLPGRTASVRSSMASISEAHRFNLGFVDMLSPRPTLRYSLQSHYTSGAMRSTAPSRAESKKDPRPLSKQTSNKRDTIDEYADDMDARTLRELMERDQKRVERRRRTEERRARRKLERYAARGEEEDAARRARERELDAFDQPAAAAAGPSGMARDYPLASEQLQPSPDHREPAVNPFDDTRNTDASPYAVASDTYPETNTRTAYAGIHPSPPASPQHRRTPATQEVRDTSNYDQPEPAPGAKRGGALAALFRRSGVGKRGTPAAAVSERSFSNTSRESMSRQTSPPQLHEQPYRALSTGGSSVPSRTKSKFREDLPESPLSPPDSRMQSPDAGEVEALPPLPSEQSRFIGAGPLPEPHHSHSASYDSVAPASAGMLSQSLASVDSEGSWLSGGRPKKRTSQQMSIARSSLANRPLGESNDDLSNVGSDFNRGSIGGGEAPPSVQEDKPEPRLQGHETGGEQLGHGSAVPVPTIVREEDKTDQRQSAGGGISPMPTPSDTEYYETADEVASHGTTPDQLTPDVGEGAQLEQATPAYGLQHVRSISAGSARLLDIPARRDSWQPSPRKSSHGNGAT